MEDWLQLTAVTPPAAGEAVSEALFSAGAGGVWEDYPDSSGRLVLKAGFWQGDEMRLMAEIPGALRTISEALGVSLLDFELSLELMPGEDYAESWKRDLKPLYVSDRLIVSPSWWEGPLESSPETKILKLDPGSAFGSGHHPTTFLCLTLLAQLTERGLFFNDVLDLGAGSAILALSAALLLPKANVKAIDDDPETLYAAKKNINLNELGSRLTPEITTISSLEGPFDLIMANLTRNALTELAKDIGARSRVPGRLILSGLLADQAPDAAKAFSSLGFEVESHLGLAEWSALSLARGLQIVPNPERVILETASPLAEVPPAGEVEPSGPDGPSPAEGNSPAEGDDPTESDGPGEDGPSD
ncbi:MAG: 50S ribosomal protein L11 methyltransferase [Deltaproteobacteria bacterium]|jgi:ribosomal protein L11 methyltransferase|nr:50S ribosomal protein L11 methyltransferase [Deltaproteobacteria bacterium]